MDPVRHDGGPAPTAQAPLVVETATAPTLETLLQRLRGERLVYVPETHTRNGDHRLQLAVLRALPKRGLALGVEWFQARFQPALDDFVAGRIDEAEMLERTQYFSRWGFDYRLYRPIILHAREHHIPIIALNASRELTDAIRDRGIAALQRPLSDELPDSYDLEDEAYDRKLREVFARHRRKGARFDRFREVQLTWDESMAQAVSRYLAADPQRRMLVLAGRGHIGGRHGIPNRVTRRTGLRGVIVASYVEDQPPREQADFLVLEPDRPLPPAGLIGVLLDLADGRITVKGFTPGSAGRAAGLLPGDRILAVDGRPTESFARFKLELLERRPGDTVALTVQRERDGRTLRKRVTVTLKGPSDGGGASPHRR